MSQRLELFRGFVGGCLSGCSQVLVMQPFEIIKVRLVNQSLQNPTYSGIRDCIRKILVEQGIFSFYKGFVSPFFGYGLQGAFLFGSNQIFKNIITYIKDEKREEKPRPMSQIFISGIFTGIVSSLIITPPDYIRTIMQKEANNIYRGSLDASKQIYKSYGIKGLYLGFNPTLVKEIITIAIYFYSYEYIMRLFAPKGQGSSSAPLMVSLFAGGIAGVASSLITYPIDYIKTRIQSQHLGNLQFKNSIHCARELYKAQGVKTFFKGFGITMLQSFPGNAVAFFSYEFAMRTMGWKKQ